jgi:hypothetical protein
MSYIKNKSRRKNDPTGNHKSSIHSNSRQLVNSNNKYIYLITLDNPPSPKYKSDSYAIPTNEPKSMADIRILSRCLDRLEYFDNLEFI